MVGMERQRVQERRQAYEMFGDVYRLRGNLKWTHFRLAMAWPDTEEFLGWAQENKATVAEMKAWRRGEDLTDSNGPI
jgi:hypothetical protein